MNPKSPGTVHRSPLARARRPVTALLAALPALCAVAAGNDSPLSDSAPVEAVASSQEEMSIGSRSANARFEVSQTPGQALGLTPATQQNPGLGGSPGFQAATQTMLWARGGERLAVGVGVEQRWQGQDAMQQQRVQGTAPARDANVLVGVSMVTSDNSRLTWQAPLARNDNPALNPSGVTLPERQMSVGLAFRARDPYSDLRRGSLMKVELSGPTVLSLRPRHGRLAVMLSSKW